MLRGLRNTTHFWFNLPISWIKDFLSIWKTCAVWQSNVILCYFSIALGDVMNIEGETHLSCLWNRWTWLFGLGFDNKERSTDFHWNVNHCTIINHKWLLAKTFYGSIRLGKQKSNTNHLFRNLSSYSLSLTFGVISKTIMEKIVNLTFLKTWALVNCARHSYSWHYAKFINVAIIREFRAADRDVV